MRPCHYDLAEKRESRQGRAGQNPHNNLPHSCRAGFSNRWKCAGPGRRPDAQDSGGRPRRHRRAGLGRKHNGLADSSRPLCPLNSRATVSPPDAGGHLLYRVGFQAYAAGVTRACPGAALVILSIHCRNYTREEPDGPGQGPRPGQGLPVRARAEKAESCASDLGSAHWSGYLNLVRPFRFGRLSAQGGPDAELAGRTLPPDRA
jgi:hypothetical protein